MKKPKHKLYDASKECKKIGDWIRGLFSMDEFVSDFAAEGALSLLNAVQRKQKNQSRHGKGPAGDMNQLYNYA